MKPLQNESTQELILRAAKALFLERGVDNTSTTDIANKSHVVRNSVRYYFKTKKDIQRAVTEDVMNRLANITVQKIQLNELNWVMMSFVFWHRFYNDIQFRNFCLQCIGKQGDVCSDYQHVYEALYRYFPNHVTYEAFIEQNYLALRLSEDVCAHLMEFYSERLEMTDYKTAAANEVRLSLRLCGISDEIISGRLEEAMELLPTLDLEKMGQAMG